MKNYKHYGILIFSFLLLMQQVMAQLPDFKKMTPAQIQAWQKEFIAQKTKGLANMDNLMLTPPKIDTGATTISFEYHEEFTSNSQHWAASIIGSAMAAPAFYAEGSDKIEVRTITSPASMIGVPVDNKLTGNMTYSGSSSGCPASGRSAGEFDFYFSYDPVTKVGTIVGGADYIHVLGGKCEKGLKQNYESEQHLKFGGHNDMTSWKIPGAASPANPNDGMGFFMIDKVGAEYKITYNNTSIKGGEKSVVSFTASISFKPSKWEAVIYPVDPKQYPKWIPEGPKVDGSTDKGNSIKFKMVVRNKNDTAKLYIGDYKTEWQLSDVSMYPGYCGNYPAYSASPDIKPDLRFENTSPPSPDFVSITDDQAKTKKGKGNVDILIRSYDYASIGTLSASVILEDGTPLPAINYVNTNSTLKIVIPKDDNNNKIADQWEVDSSIYAKNYRSKWDENEKPDNGFPGDQFTLLDEYRGFVNHDDGGDRLMRLSPNYKNLFVINNGEINNNVRTGVLNFGKVTGIAVHYYRTNQYTYQKPDGIARFPRWINFNSDEKKAFAVNIFCSDESLADHKGEAFCKPLLNNNGMPSNELFMGDLFPEEVDYIHIDHKYIVNNMNLRKDWYHRNVGDTGGSPAYVLIHIKHANDRYLYNPKIDENTLGTTFNDHISDLISEMVTFTVLHELGHATHRHHHFAAPVHSVPKLGIDYSYYCGDNHCPMRYWYATVGGQTPPICDDIFDWYFAFISTKWNPALLTLPDGGTFKFCKTGDNCNVQMRLKKP